MACLVQLVDPRYQLEEAVPAALALPQLLICAQYIVALHLLL